MPEVELNQTQHSNVKDTSKKRFTLVYKKINQKYNLKSIYLVQKEKTLNDKFYGTWHYHF